jgi:hypothetical protein
MLIILIILNHSTFQYLSYTYIYSVGARSKYPAYQQWLSSSATTQGFRQQASTRLALDRLASAPRRALYSKRPGIFTTLMKFPSVKNGDRLRILLVKALVHIDPCFRPSYNLRTYQNWLILGHCHEQKMNTSEDLNLPSAHLAMSFRIKKTLHMYSIWLSSHLNRKNSVIYVP